VSLAACLSQLSLSLFLWSTVHRGPWDTWQHRSSPLRKAESGAVGHMTAPELTSARRRAPEPRDTWQRRSSPQQGGEVRGHGTRGNVRAYLSMEARSGAAGHVVTPERTSAGRCDPKLQLTCQCVDARPGPCLDLDLVYGGTRFYDISTGAATGAVRCDSFIGRGFGLLVARYG
jgi:hypothetical protein